MSTDQQNNELEEQSQDWTTVSAPKRKYVQKKFSEKPSSTPTTPLSSTTHTVTTVFDNTPKKRHMLSAAYSFWFFKKEKGGSDDYEENMKKIGDFDSVEGFWGFYSHLIRPNDFTPSSDFHLFKRGIKPMWEDEANFNGGKWMIRLKKEFTPRLWEDLLLATIGDQFDVGDEICGIVLSVRDHDILSVWNKNHQNKEAREKIRNTLITVLKLPAETKMEYKVHQASLALGHSTPPKYQSELYVVKHSMSLQGDEEDIK